MTAEDGPGEQGEVEVLLFELGGVRMGADASQVLRIERPNVPGARRSPLGSPEPGRALVFRDGDSEGSLEVERVLGVWNIPAGELRRMPRAALGSTHAIGFWLDGNRPVLLIDLPGTLADSVSGTTPHPTKVM